MPLRLLVLYIFALLSTIRRVTAFDRDTCLQSAQWLLGNHTISPDSPFFYRDKPDSPPYTDPSNMTLTLAGCNAICGPEQSWYPDVGSRLNAWLVPILLLFINVEVSPHGKRSFLEVLHLLGDPIDSLWSLLHKIDAWDRCYASAKQYNRAGQSRTLCPSCRLIVATVFAGYEEVQGPRVTSGDNSFEALLNHYHLVDHFDEWRRAAVDLADSRTDELLRTVLALILYLYQPVSNFVPAVGGVPSSPPGSRIATAVLLSCFIPPILLTNSIGNFGSRRNAYSIMAIFAVRTGGHALHVSDQTSLFLPDLPLLAQKSSSNYYEAQAWCGGIYMYRPWKLRYVTVGRSPLYHTFIYGLLAATPVIIGFIGGSLLLWWETPRGFNCRHIWMIAVPLLWILSAIITLISYNHKLMTGKYHWRFVLVKDAVIAIPCFTMFFLSSAGLFNSCWCWSGPWEYPDIGRVILPPTFNLSDGTIMYPTTLSTALLLQFLVVAFVVWTRRRGFWLLRWSDKNRQEESNRSLAGAELCSCISSNQKNMSHNSAVEAVLLKQDDSATS